MNVKINFKKIRLEDAVCRFIAAKRAERLSEQTIRSYISILEMFNEYIGKDVNFGKINVGNIREYLGQRNDVSNKTLYNYHTVLSSLWSWAVEDGYADENIIRHVKTPRYKTPRIIPFSRKEIQKLVDCARYVRNRAILMILIDCGIRASELIGLDIDDWESGVLKVLGKGNKERVVPISEPTEQAIIKYLFTRKVLIDGFEGGLAMFTGFAYPYERLEYGALNSIMIRLGQYSGIPNVYCHRFRHTFAINYLRNGGDIYTLQKILGHTTLDMVRTYLDIVRADLSFAHAKASPVMHWFLGMD